MKESTATKLDIAFGLLSQIQKAFSEKMIGGDDCSVSTGDGVSFLVSFDSSQITLSREEVIELLKEE